MPKDDLDGLAGRVCVVTGATKGIGRAVAERLAAAKASVVVSSRHQKACDKVAADLRRKHRVETLGVACDVGEPASVKRLFGSVQDWTRKPVHVLANVAGYPVDPKLWDTPLHKLSAAQAADFSAVYDTDLRGSRLCSHYALKQMVKARTGSIVFVSSTPALVGYKGTPYTEAKAGILGLMRDLAREYGPYGIRSNAVAPGNIRTSWLDQVSVKDRKALEKESPLRRFGQVGEVADAITFLAGDRSSFITGQVLVVDGGTVSH